VVLDNFEQITRYAEATLGQWLDRSPQARFIVTTREVLGIAGEEILEVPPLSDGEAVDLFMRRASAARHGYTPNAEDTAATRLLVRTLDGLPLAIELAAARVRVMSPRMLMARMRDHFDVIGAKGGRHDRQATLRNAFDWSWELLVDNEKAALAMLSVFEGGFTLDSAAAVIAPADRAAYEVIEVVQGLVDKSFVRRPDEDRFDLLETVREYAARRLREEGSFAGSGARCAAETSARHWRHFAALDERAAVAQRCIEAKNLLAACRTASSAGEALAATACLVGAWSALRLTGPYRAAVGLAEAVRAIPNLGSRERALVHWVAGDALELLGEVHRARPELKQGAACAADAQAPECSARLLITIGKCQTLDGELEAASSSLDDAYRLATEVGDVELQMRALNALGLHSDHQSKWKDAQGYYERALTLAKSLGDRRMEGGLLGNLGGLYHDMGELEAAEANYEMSLNLANQLGDFRWEGNARSNLGLLYQEQGRAAKAGAQFEAALAMARQVGHARLEYTVLCNLGILLSGEGKIIEAAQHFERAVDAAVACADVRAEGQFRGYLAVNQARRGLVAEARASLELGEQRLLKMGDRLSYALLLCDQAEVELLAGCDGPASQALADARRAAVALECREDSELCRRIAMLSHRLVA
jgi:predicted ATPase